MIFEDRIQVNPRLFRLKDPRTNEIVDFEIQDLLPEEIIQEGTEIDAAYLNGLLTYSMEEKQVGYWIDGKPIYKKVFNFGNLPNTAQKLVDHNINVDTPILCYGVVTNSNASMKFSIPMATVDLWFDTRQVCVITQQDRSTQTADVTLLYTKTTD